MRKKPIILIILVILIVGGIYYFEKMKVSLGDFDEVEAVQDDRPALKNGFPLSPELVGISGYLNTDEIKISDLKGKVVLVDFWTYTCINCIRTLPFIVDWDRKYRDKGLVIIGVHTPEFEFEKEKENVENAILKYGIKYPVVQDNDYATWRAFQNRYWPHKYLIDKDGYIRYDHIGEGNYDETEKQIQKLLSEIGEDVTDMGTSDIEEKTPKVRQTLELYAGYEFALPRGQNIGNKGGMKAGKVEDYSIDDVKEDVIYLEGKWKSNVDNLQAQDDEKSSIVLSFLSGAVNIVGDTFGESLKLEVFIDGQHVREEFAGDDVQFEDGKAFVLVDEARLYNVFRGDYGRYELRLSTHSKDFSFNAFTFG